MLFLFIPLLLINNDKDDNFMVLEYISTPFQPKQKGAADRVKQHW